MVLLQRWIKVYPNNILHVHGFRSFVDMDNCVYRDHSLTKPDSISHVNIGNILIITGLAGNMEYRDFCSFVRTTGAST